MTRRLALAVLLVLACGAGMALAIVVGSRPASAHASDCHAQRTCPADDGTYAWTDANGLAWVCFARNPADPAQAGATEVVFEGLPYACRDAATTPTVATTTAATTTAETAPTTTAATTASETTATTVPIETEPVWTGPLPTIADVEYERVAETPIGPLRVAEAQREHAAAAPAKPRKARAPVVPEVVLPPSGIVPKLTARGYVFPVYGPSAFVDTFGAGRATTGWHHGEDIFAQLGAPVLAVADGILFSVGWNDVGGNRLWLRDTFGNQFYYAHLSAFSPLAVDGRPVRAGEVIGFVGTTGDADGTPPHLHFEIHPLGLLSLGYDGVIAPYQYLTAWKRLSDLAFASVGLARIGWRSLAPMSIAAPTPGALLLSSSDISTASSLEEEGLDGVLDEGAAALSAESPLTASPATPSSPTAGPPVAGLARQADAAAILAVLRREARTAAGLAASAQGIWDALSLCEAGGRWSYDGSSGFDGGLQFHPSTWSSYRLPGYPALAWQATREQQIAVGRRVLSEQGWQAWPVCSRTLGLR